MVQPSDLALTRAQLSAARRFLVTSHIRPDGDAIGSLIGMGLALQLAGKEVEMVLADGLPAAFRFLPGADQVQNKIKGRFDYSIVLDSSDLERIGDIFPPGEFPDLNIDHHPTNDFFARINLVDPTAVSTTEILGKILPELGLPVTKSVASALLTGLVTDTIGFRVAGMTPAAMRLAADLMEAGANLPEIYQQTLIRRSLVAARLWGIGLTNLQSQDGVVWTTISRHERQSIGYAGRDDADLINILPTIDGVKIAIIFLEQSPDRVKISWRSNQEYDVSDLASKFGGGGHRNAAGAEIPGTLDDVQERVLLATRELVVAHEQPA
jgi:bifunctional oligoribonuclease and PAP phosphatase NrnA